MSLSNSLKFHSAFTSEFTSVRLDFPIISMPFCGCTFEFLSTSCSQWLRAHFDLIFKIISNSLRCHFEFTLLPCWSCFELTPISFSYSLRHQLDYTFEMTCNYLRIQFRFDFIVDFTAIPSRSISEFSSISLSNSLRPRNEYPEKIKYVPSQTKNARYRAPAQILRSKPTRQTSCAPTPAKTARSNCWVRAGRLAISAPNLRSINNYVFDWKLCS